MVAENLLYQSVTQQKHSLLNLGDIHLHSFQLKNHQNLEILVHSDKKVKLPHSTPSEILSSASSQLEDGPQSGIIIGIAKVSPVPSPPSKIS